MAQILRRAPSQTLPPLGAHPHPDTYSAALPGAREPMKAQGAPSKDRTVQVLEALPPLCQRCERHLQGGQSPA